MRSLAGAGGRLLGCHDTSREVRTQGKAAQAAEAEGGRDLKENTSCNL